jgi:Leucine-rich repeat (LRR) protein
MSRSMSSLTLDFTPSSREAEGRMEAEGASAADETSLEPSAVAAALGPRYKDQMRQAGVPNIGESKGGNNELDEANPGIVHRDDNDNEEGSNSVTAEEVTIPVVHAAFAADWREEQLRANEQRQAEADAGRLAAEQLLAPAATSTHEGGNNVKQRIANLSKKQRLIIGLVSLGLFLIMAIGVPIGICDTGFGIVRCRRHRSPIRAQVILQYINSVTLTGRKLTYGDDSSPEGRAIQWLIDKDVGTLPSDELKLRQRYVLATLEFQTPKSSVEYFSRSPTRSPSSPVEDDDDNGKTWMINRHECEWGFVDCDNSFRVTSLLLNDGSIIPDDVGLLTSLNYLNVNGGAAPTGTLPSTLGALTALRTLDLSGHELTGTIPSSLGTLTALTSLSLTRFFHGGGLTGALPSTFGALTALSLLWLSRNRLTGVIPSTLGAMTALSALWLDSNALTGTIPSSLGTLTSLEDLWLSDNLLAGAIPSSLASLMSLKQMCLFNNLLSGRVPFSFGFGSSTSLRVLSLSSNVLTGSLPSQLGLLTSLTFMDFGSNQLIGNIPAEWQSLTSLAWLALNNNTMLTGTIPSALNSLTSLWALQLSNTSITGTMPWCGRSNQTMFELLIQDCNDRSSGVVACPCCTHCCPAGGWSIGEGPSYEEQMIRSLMMRCYELDAYE